MCACVCVEIHSSCASSNTRPILEFIFCTSWHLKKKKAGGGQGVDTVGFVHCWPMEKSWKLINASVCQSGWSVFSS